MIFNARKTVKSSDEPLLAAMARLLADFCPTQAHFFDSWPAFLRLVGAASGSFSIFDPVTGSFLIKTWAGQKPMRFSVGSTGEFLRYLKLRKEPAFRRDFTEDAHDLRQEALLFFQEFSADMLFPIVDDRGWVGMMALQTPQTKTSAAGIDAIDEQNLARLNACSIYAHWARLALRLQALQTESEKLSSLRKTKDELLANVTHELQTPLNGILGLVESLVSDDAANLPESLREPLGMIQSAGQDLSRTVNGIMQLATIASGKTKNRRERVSVWPIIEEVADLYSSLLAESGNVCEFTKERQAISVYADPDQLRTVLMNLFGNAAKFTQQGKVRVSVRKSGEMAHITISDTGIGIDGDKLEMIFEDFYQADGSATRGFGGTGIGLAIVRKIIHNHGGRIWAESHAGEGSSFTFTLPLTPL